MSSITTTVIAALFFGCLHANPLVNPPGLTERQTGSCLYWTSNASSCGQVCVAGFAGPDCTAPAASTIIKDTNGYLAPLNWTSDPDGPIEVKSLKYFGPVSAHYAGCGAVHFEFYDHLGNVKDEVYMTPGQLDAWCIDFSNDTVVNYSGYGDYTNCRNVDKVNMECA